MGNEGSGAARPRAIGINHVALEVGDIDGALEFYGGLFHFELRSRGERMAFIDLGDQFIALSRGREQAADTKRHFGLVVDDLEAVRERVVAAGAEVLAAPGLSFLDPWGNHVQIVEYGEIQFSKTDGVLRGMNATDLEKTEAALAELADKGMAPPAD